jgi:hypothetical protein
VTVQEAVGAVKGGDGMSDGRWVMGALMGLVGEGDDDSGGGLRDEGRARRGTRWAGNETVRDRER